MAQDSEVLAFKTERVPADDAGTNRGSNPLADRSRQVVRVSAIGIATNVLLAAFKLVVGLISNSIAIVLDAVNNLSDAASSIITIVGTYLAQRSADHEHPYGFGRIEYLTTIIIAALVLWAGITSLVESVQRIVHPELSSYSALALLIIVVAVVVKFLLGTYVIQWGKKLSSDALVASGTDSKMDSILSASTVVAAVITILFGISIETWVGALISLVIIKAGFDILRETVGKLLGERVPAELSHQVKATVDALPEVIGAYDLFLGDYGPDRLMGSIHVEVADNMTAAQIDTLTRTIQQQVFAQTGVLLHTVGIYSHNTAAPESQAFLGQLKAVVMAHPEVKELHGFYLDEKNKRVRADVVISYKTEGRQQLFARLCREAQAALTGYEVSLTLDADISD